VPEQPADALDRVVAWATTNDDIRALILEGSRANPYATPDAYSDYDIALIVRDPAAFADSHDWESWYGEPLVHWHESGQPEDRLRTMRLVIYEDGTRIDYCIWPREAIDRMTAAGALPPILDSGYRVLVDKDGITEGLPPATHDPHLLRPPDEREFANYVDDFWIDAAYVAKSLARGELLPAQMALSSIAIGHMRRLLEWRAAIDAGWTLRPRAYGRGLRALVPPQRWARLEALFPGADPDACWDALGLALDLHREIAAEVGDALGYAYPYERDARVGAYLRSLRPR
jgi:aminoglycoside 6-adenylyltransferase